ncbi:hypothetical protein Ct61P_09872 [Colletotrichum tofieldiae]|nr:hypothetical protein Ct61P_09872 [Colletotrichum tofieldiae]
MPVGNKDQNSGVTGGAKFVTSALGNTVGGITKTVGNVTNAATTGLGDTITSATGSAGRPVGDGITNLGQGLGVPSTRSARASKTLDSGSDLKQGSENG